MKDDPSSCTTRFAPSPTGLLHLGHAFSALVAERRARQSGGHFLLRIEDLDHTRSRPEHEEAIFEDLGWLGVAWEKPVVRQSERKERYEVALQNLRERELLYPCFCTRKEMITLDAPHGSVLDLYAGACRDLNPQDREQRLADGTSHAWRLDARKAFSEVGESLIWEDENHGPQEATAEKIGDVVLGRKDIGTSYHVAVVVDDADQDVSLVTRGEDLLDSTHVHRLLQELLDLPVPGYAHHRLVTDPEGKRLATRDRATALRTLREEGVSPEEIRLQLEPHE